MKTASSVKLICALAALMVAGVLVVVSPRLSVLGAGGTTGAGEALGAVLVLGSALCAATAQV